MAKECIIVGNGPSLKNVSNESLSKVPTFGTNGVLIKFDPTYYVAVNPLAIARFAFNIATSKAKKFMIWNEIGVQYELLQSMPVPLFSFNPLEWVYEGHTVTIVCLQLAFFMGYDTVYLVGVDHSYVFEGAPNEARVLQGDDPNHFDPDYFRDSLWNNPDLERSEHAYNLALEAFTDDGRTIVNCSPDSKLEIFSKGVLPW